MGIREERLGALSVPATAGISIFSLPNAVNFSMSLFIACSSLKIMFYTKPGGSGDVGELLCGSPPVFPRRLTTNSNFKEIFVEFSLVLGQSLM